MSIDPANDLAVLPYSSGTTGLPKGVMLTHRNIVAQLKQIDAIENIEMPALLGVLPFFHIYGMVIIMMHGLMRGATIVTMPKFEFEPFLKVLQDWPITSAHIVPPIVVALGKHPAGRQLQVPAPEIHVLGRGAARPRADRGGREAAQHQDPPGLRHDRSEPGHALHRRRDGARPAPSAS